MNITLHPDLAQLGISIHVAILSFPVAVAGARDDLNETIADAAERRRSELVGQAASSDPVIERVRRAFKTAGKDPSRYRPSSEALTRRVLTGDTLPTINTAVDCANVLSLMTGIPVGLYDAAKLAGEDIVLRIGAPGETYASLGRGDINLEGLFLLADEVGPFGTPFSDSIRTSVDLNTQDLHLVLFGLNISKEETQAATELADQLMLHFVVDKSRFDENAV